MNFSKKTLIFTYTILLAKLAKICEFSRQTSKVEFKKLNFANF